MKFYVYPGIYQYSERMITDFNCMAGCSVFHNSGVTSVVERLLLSNKMPVLNCIRNGYISHRYEKKIDKSTQQTKVMVFIDSNRLAYVKEYLKHVRKLGNVICIYYFLNSTVQINPSRVKYVKENFDYVISYDRDDCINNNWLYYGGFYSHDDEEKKSPEEYDVLFIGRNKGRLEAIRRIYTSLCANGFKCYFSITDVRKEDVMNDGIIYNKQITYSDLIEYTKKANTILEYVQSGQSGFTFRLLESIAYNKLLLSNNASIASTEYYDSNNMYIYSNCNIDYSELRRKMVHTPNTAVLSVIEPRRFIHFIEDAIIANTSKELV